MSNEKNNTEVPIERVPIEIEVNEMWSHKLLIPKKMSATTFLGLFESIEKSIRRNTTSAPSSGVGYSPEKKIRGEMGIRTVFTDEEKANLKQYNKENLSISEISRKLNKTRHQVYAVLYDMKRKGEL